MPIQEFDFTTGKVLDPKRKQVLLMLGDDSDLECMRLTCREKRFSVKGKASDEKAVFELARKYKGGVVIYDSDIPDIDSKAFLSTFKQRFPDFKIVLASNGLTKEAIVEAQSLDVVAFLAKPISADAASKVLERLQ